MRAPPRIARTIIQSKRRPSLRRSSIHLAFVREIGICLACGAHGPCQAAHVRGGTDGGMGIKPSDKFAVPLCLECHARQHRQGEGTFWGSLGIDPLDVASRLWTVSCNFEAGLRCIQRARQAIELRKREARE